MPDPGFAAVYLGNRPPIKQPTRASGAVQVKPQFSQPARPAGFEPATRCLEGSCSVRLSYGRSEIIVAGEYHASATCRSQCVAPRTTADSQVYEQGTAVTTSPVAAIRHVGAEQLHPRVGASRIAKAEVGAYPL